jgi:hypothetical protein
MTEAEFDRWVAILRDHVPEFPRLADVGTTFVPCTPEDVAAEVARDRLDRPVKELRDQDGATRRRPSLGDAAEWFDVIRPGDRLRLSRWDGGELSISRSTRGEYSARCVDAHGHGLVDVPALPRVRAKEAVARYVCGELDGCLALLTRGFDGILARVYEWLAG